MRLQFVSAIISVARLKLDELLHGVHIKEIWYKCYDTNTSSVALRELKIIASVPEKILGAVHAAKYGN